MSDCVWAKEGVVFFVFVRLSVHVKEMSVVAHAMDAYLYVDLKKSTSLRTCVLFLKRESGLFQCCRYIRLCMYGSSKSLEKEGPGRKWNTYA